MNESVQSKWFGFYSRTSNIKNIAEDILFHAALFKAVISTRPQSILEVGIGKGSMSIILGSLGFQVTGVDNDESLVRLASKRIQNTYLCRRVTFAVADGFHLGDFFSGDPLFDCCFSQGLLEHFSDEEIRRLLNEQLRVTRVAIFSVPSVFFPFQEFGNERLLSIEEWVGILQGYNIRASKYYGRLLSFDVGLRHMMRKKKITFAYMNKFTNILIKIER